MYEDIKPEINNTALYQTINGSTVEQNLKNFSTILDQLNTASKEGKDHICVDAVLLTEDMITELRSRGFVVGSLVKTKRNIEIIQPEE